MVATEGCRLGVLQIDRRLLDRCTTTGAHLKTHATNRCVDMSVWLAQLTTTPWAESSSISVPPQHGHVLLCAAAMAAT